MRIVIASDSFKDALSAEEVCSAITEGLRAALPEAELVSFPLADGGEGTAHILTQHSGGSWQELRVADPLFRPCQAGFGLSSDNRAFIEMASASGLPLLTESERNPLRTSTYGTGELIAAALTAGATEIYLCLGGSATNDAGMGMARALGYRFLDETGQELEGRGADLIRVRQIDNRSVNPLLEHCRITALCDVRNPLYGPQGAAHVYGPQKGASPSVVQELDEGLRHFGSVLEGYLGQSIQKMPGAGAAGGLGAGAVAFLGAKLQGGVDTVLEATSFGEVIKNTNWIITGEGQLDHQTQAGKLIAGLCQLAQQKEVPVIALCGALKATPQQIQQMGLQSAFSITQQPVSLETALQKTGTWLSQTAFQIGQLL